MIEQIDYIIADLGDSLITTFEAYVRLADLRPVTDHEIDALKLALYRVDLLQAVLNALPTIGYCVREQHHVQC